MESGLENARPADGTAHGRLWHTRPARPFRTPEERKDWRGYTLRRLLLGADIAAIGVAFLVAELYELLTAGRATFDGEDLLRVGLGVPVWLLFAHVQNLYYVESRRADHGVAEELGPTAQLVTLWVWTMMLIGYAIGLASPTVPELFVFWVAGIAAMVGIRSAARAWSRARPWYVENAVVVADASRAGDIVSKIRRHPEYGINVVACVDASPNGAQPTQDVAGLRPAVPMIEGDGALPNMIEEFDVDRVIVAWWPESSAERFELIDGLVDAGVNVDLVPGWFELIGLKLELHEMEGTPLLRVPSRSLGHSSMVLKRTFDLVFGGLALLLMLPVMAVCALAIKLDSRGPVFFRQRRVGRGGEPFELLKFRSMEVCADERKCEIEELNLHGNGLGQGMFKARTDPRVTRVGRFLRRTSLDETPQLISVVRGDMSLVGARPLIEEEDRQIVGRLRRRLDLTPGLTGLWQVHGRSEIPFETMIKLDYLYVSSWSLWGDVRILLRTISAVLRGQGAY